MDFMKLILKIISDPKNGALSENRKVFDSNFSIIGRSANADWTLPDPDRFISSKHAEIIQRDNVFYIKDISSNGIINSATDEAIGNNQELLIANNQKFLIGDYLIQAEIESDPSLQGYEANQTGIDENAQWENQMDDFWGNSSDPLDLLASNQAKPNETAEIQEVLPSLANAIERTPAFKQAMSFAPNDNPNKSDSQSISLDNNNTSEPGIPENWDHTSFSLPEIIQEKPIDSIAKPQQAPQVTTNDNQEDSFFQQLEDDSFFENNNCNSNENILAPKPDQVSAEKPAKANFSRPAATRPRQRSNTADVPPQSIRGNDKLLESARQAFTQQGLDEKLLTEETAAQWLELMPTVIQGTLELLQARAAIKNEFRVSKTLLNTSENNPLKFSVNAEDAILSLFHQKRPGFLPAQPAFEQAFSDIKIHQSALLHGVRVAMMGLLKQFDAESLEKEFSSSTQNTNFLDKLGSSKSAQAKLWQQYKDLYNNEYRVDSDDSFQRIFGENFADAYGEFSSDV